MKRYTIEDALEAVDNMDDYARMSMSIDPIGARTVLETFIDQYKLLEESNISYANKLVNMEGQIHLLKKQLEEKN